MNLVDPQFDPPLVHAIALEWPFRSLSRGSTGGAGAGWIAIAEWIGAIRDKLALSPRRRRGRGEPHREDG